MFPFISITKFQFTFKQYLACLSTSSSNDKLSFDVGLQEHSHGEACWWTVHPASKQRSEGEKVRVGDDLILVSVATERYLVRNSLRNSREIEIQFYFLIQHTTKENDFSIVNASFHVTHWSVQPYGTGISRMKYVGYVFGGDVLRFFHGGDECLTIPSTWTRQQGQKYEPFNFKQMTFLTELFPQYCRL